MKIKSILLIALIILSLFISSCKSEDDTGDKDLEQFAGYTAMYLYEAIGYIYDLSSTVLYSELLTRLLTYDPTTGYWSIDKKTPLGYSIVVKIKFLDQNGNVQKYYDLNTTYTIISEGKITGPQGSTTFALNMSGLSSASDYYLTNGNGTSSYSGYEGNYTINNLKMSKQDDVYPESGTITVSSQGQTITITFNGTDTVKATYTYNGHSITFYINLTTGAISY